MWGRLLSLFRRERLARELSVEIEFHLGMLVEEKIRLGVAPDEAMAAARREFGGVERTKDQYRAVRGLPLFESILADCARGADHAI